MANYLLLRNNKESGPHSLDDLMELGLKPYDLVWIQGKSAAWRYPSEVEELKPFAPVVEEQPFDRFYKKQTEEKKEVTIQREEQFVPQKQEEPTIAPEHEKYIPKKSVFVTMPGQKTNAVKPAVKEETYKAPVPAPTTTPTPVQQTISVTENPVAAQIKYSQPLDEIKEMYVKTLYDRKQKIARKGFWLQSLKKAAAILLLIAVGLIAGFVIKSNGGDKKEIAKTSTASETSKTIIDPSLNVSETNTIQQESKVIPPPSGGYVNAPTQRVEEPVASGSMPKSDPFDEVKKETTQPSMKNEPGITAIAPGVEMDPATGERSRKLRTEGSRGNTNNGNSNSNSTDVKSFRNNDHLAGMVTVTSNEYKKVAFGGIRNLELTITNDSKYTLDKVLVELQYLKPSELPLKTENIEFKTVGPKTTSTVKIPDTNRGIKVVYRIINIKSREMDELASGN